MKTTDQRNDHDNKGKDVMKRKLSPDGTKHLSCLSSKKAKDRCHASDALLGIDIIEKGSKVCVRLADGWEHVLPQKGEDDPGCLIMWEDDNIAATVTNFNTAIAAGAAPPLWLNAAGGPIPITIPGLKAALLAHVQVTGGGGGVVGNALIAPNTVSEFSRVTTSFSLVGVEPFFIQHAQCPIGRHYILVDRRANATATADPILAPPAGLGVQVFA